VRAGLVGLGWQARDAEQAIAAVEADLAAEVAAAGHADGGAGGSDANGGQAAGAPQEADVAAMLRAALRKLSRA
jgi:hypothetical protein